MNNQALDDARASAEVLRKRLRSTLVPADISRIAKIPFKLQACRELFLHRASDLGDAACLLFEQDRVIPAATMTRAAFETMAALNYLRLKVEGAVEEGNAPALDTVAMTGLFGCRDGLTSFEATNVLTAIKHLGKLHHGLPKMFEDLCEYAHPNFAGVTAAYQGPCDLSRDPAVPLTFGREAANLEPDRPLICLHIALHTCVVLADQLANMDAEVAKLCEAQF